MLDVEVVGRERSSGLGSVSAEWSLLCTTVRCQVEPAMLRQQAQLVEAHLCLM